ncbi:hypothetical protein [Paraburkholderia diazotrophica]|uniref:hypothetical protein n=1 Tax=Paraburkholderia diazotrophica TaxID=667676 RepID=UPI0015A70E9D|nr:hypothetical protein [Paraburkholderia diazotrophica]
MQPQFAGVVSHAFERSSLFLAHGIGVLHQIVKSDPPVSPHHPVRQPAFPISLIANGRETGNRSLDGRESSIRMRDSNRGRGLRAQAMRDGIGAS